MPRLPTTDYVTSPKRQGFNARLGELYVRLAPADDTPYMVVAPQSEPPRYNTGLDAEEYIGTDGQVFARANFTGGEGLGFAHRADATEEDFKRFWDSANMRAPVVDPGTPLYIDMSKSYRDVSTSLTDIIAVATVPLTERVVVVGTTGWEAYEDLEDPTAPTLAGSAALVGAVDAIGLGDAVYVVHGTATVTKITDDGAGNFAATTEATTPGGGEIWARIWAAKGRLFLAEAVGGSLWEYQFGTPTPTEVTAERLIHPSQSWTSVVDAGSVIAAGGSDGRVYFFAPDNTGALELVSSTPLPEDERIRDLAYNQGVLLIATEELNWTDAGTTESTGRLYQARVGTVLESVQLIKRFDTISSPVPKNFTTTRDSIFFTTRDGTTINVWRFLLPTLGLFREDRFTGDNADVVGYANPAQTGTLVQPSRLFMETPNATSEDSWVILPAIDFFTASPKSWQELRLSIGNMPTGGEISVLYSTEIDALTDYQHSSWQTARVVREDVDEIRVPLSNVYSRYLIMQIRMVRGTDNMSPQVIAFTAIGRTDQEDELQLTLPVIVSDRIERRHRKPIRSEGYGEEIRKYLFDRKGETLNVELFDPNIQVQGVITAVQGNIRTITRRGHVLDVAQVLVRGRREIGESQALTGGAKSLGVGLLGVDPILGGV